MFKKRLNYSTEFIIFLDIDGVLIPGFSKKDKIWDKIIEEAKELSKKEGKEFNILYMRKVQSQYFSKDALRNLQNLVSILEMRKYITKVSIVIVSKWRIGLNVKDFKILFKDYSFKDLIIGKTKDHFDEKIKEDRGKDIKEWLDNYNQSINFIIIDDNNEESIKKYFTNYYKIDPNKLLTENDVNKIILLF